MTDAPTKFEEDLKVFFPEIHALNELGKLDPFIWEVVQVLRDMHEGRSFGDVLIVYQDGRINRVYKKTDQLALKSTKGYNVVKRQSIDKIDGQ